MSLYGVWDHRRYRDPQLPGQVRLSRGQRGGGFCRGRPGRRVRPGPRTLVKLRYHRLGKSDKGLVKRYLGKVTGLSRAQLTRLIAQHRKTGRVEDRRGGPQPFRRSYNGDIRQTGGGRELGQMFRPPARCSLAHVRQPPLRALGGGRICQPQRPTATFAGSGSDAPHGGAYRRAPPARSPGASMRVDTHQGDLDGVKGVYSTWWTR